MTKFPRELLTVTPLSIALSVVCFIFFMFLAFYLGIQYQKLEALEAQQLKNARSSAVTPEKSIITPTPTPTIPNDWKTYQGKILSFKYPKTYLISMGPDGVIYVRDNSKSSGPSGEYMTIDTRFTGVYANYEKAAGILTDRLPSSTKIENLANGVRVTSETQAEFTNEGRVELEVTHVYLKYKNGAVTVHFNDRVPNKREYDQILSTFQFTN